MKMVVVENSLFYSGCLIILAFCFAQIIAPVQGFIGVMIASLSFGSGCLSVGLSIEFQDSTDTMTEEKKE